MVLDVLKELSSAREKQDGVLIFNEKKYAVGLTWLTADQDEAMSLARERAKNLEADYYCVRSSVVFQHGFGYLALGHRMNMQSAAAIVSETLVGEWHGMFAADNGWWYIAVHSDAIAPDGDKLFRSEEEAFNFFVERSKAYRWPQSYAPESWDLPNMTGDISLEKFLSENTLTVLKPVNLDAMFGGKNKKQTAFMTGFFIALLLTILSIIPAILARITPEQEEIRLSSFFDLEIPDTIAVPPPPSSYVEAVRRTQRIGFATVYLPRPSKLLTLCLLTYKELVFTIPGWKLHGAACGEKGGKSVWKRNGGRLEDVQRMSSSFPPNALSNLNNASFELTLPFSPEDIRTLESPSGLLEHDNAYLSLNNAFSKMGALEIVFVDPEEEKKKRSPVRGRTKKTEDSEEDEIGLPYFRVRLRMDTPPFLVSGSFDIPGLRLVNLTWDLTTKSWAYEAKVYIQKQEEGQKK